MDRDSDNAQPRSGERQRLEGPTTAGPAVDTPSSDELELHKEELKEQNEELRRVQMELEAARAKYYELYDQAPVGYITLSSDLIIKDANRAATMLLGREKNKLTGRRLSSFISPDSQEGLFLHYERLTRGNRLGRPVTVKVGNGNHVQFESNLIDGYAGKGFRSVLTDVGKLIQTQAGLEASEMKFRSLFDSIDEGFCTIEVMFDENDKPIDYRFLEVNKAFERQTGIRNAAGKTMREIEPRHEEHWFRIYGEIARTGTPKRFTQEAKALIEGWYDVYAFKVGGSDSNVVAILFNDMTDRMRLEESLRKANESLEEKVSQRSKDLNERRQELETLMDTVPATIWISRTADGSVMIGNKEVEKLLGMPAGSNVSQTAPEDQRPAHFNAYRDGSIIPPEELPMQKAGLTGRPIIGTEFEFRFDDGRSVWVYGNAVPLKDEMGATRGVIGAFLDITERKKEEEALRETRDTLESLFSYANAPMVVWDPKLNITKFNRAFEHLTGYRSSEVIGRPLEILFPECSKRSSLAQIERTSKGEHWESVEIPIQRTDGASRTILWNSATLFSPDGSRVLMTIAQGQDITERLNAEDALRRSEDQATALVRYAPTGIFELDYRARRFISVNEAMSRILGYSEEELLRMDPLDILDDESQKRFRERVRNVLSGMDNDPTVEFGVWTGDGRKIYATLNVTLTYNGGMPETAFVIAQDITERRLMEDALKASELKYRGLFNGIQTPISIYKFVYDDRGEIVHWTLEDANPAGLALLGGRSLDEVRGKNETELYGPNNRIERLPVLRKLKADGQQIVGEMYFDWSKRYYISSLVLLDDDHFISSVTDITEIKQAQLETKESEARYRCLFENNQASMLLIDPTNGNILDANQVASEFYGYSHDALTKMNIADINTLDPEVVKEELTRSFTGTKRQFDFRHRLANGEVRDVDVYSGVIYVQGRSLLYSIIHDVTERKQIEREVVKRTNDLARSNTELQQFAYVASHDLQEPLRMVISYLSLLQRRYGDRLDDEAQAYIDFAVLGGKRMKSLIDDLLEYSRIDTQGKNFNLVDMDAIAAKVLDLLRLPIEESRAVIDVDPLPSVIADGSQMVQVLQNLISNAIKFHGPEPPRIQVSATPGSGEWIFSVKDNGIGLNMEYVDKIFQMFQRLHTREKFPGTGVGLAIVKKIVEQHGGKIWVESEEGRGATFFFSIPTVPRK